MVVVGFVVVLGGVVVLVVDLVVLVVDSRLQLVTVLVVCMTCPLRLW